MNNRFISYLVLTLFSSLSWLYSQSVNLDSFAEIQALNMQKCAVVQVNASWNYKNRVEVEKLSKLCYVGEIDLNNKAIGAVIQKEWGIKVVPTIIILKEGEEVIRYEPGISMSFDEQEVFDKIKKELNIPILTDIHNIEQCSIVASHVDVLQIPAFLCRQTDLLVAAAKTNKVINVKKGQFLAPWDMVNVTKKISDSGNKNILVTERGASFGYNTLVSDMRALPIMAKNGYPVIFDATHSVQQPGGLGEKSGGQREFVEHLARAAVAVGVAGVFIETHQDPDNAPSDGPNMIPLNKLESLLEQLTDIDNLIKK
mgnify:CR=1 FL=1